MFVAILMACMRIYSPAKILDLEPGRIRVEFETPQFAAAPGQVLVLYSGDGVVASAIIDK